jgi:hypothetical protein
LLNEAIWHARCNTFGIPPERFAAEKRKEVPMSVSFNSLGANLVSVFGALVLGVVMLSAAVPVLPVA